MNSVNNDTRFTVSQSIAFPQVYNRQRELYEAQTRGGQLNESIIRLNVKKQVTILYFDMVTMLQKIQLLTKADSLYNAFLQRQEQRFNAGEVNVLEKTFSRNTTHAGAYSTAAAKGRLPHCSKPV